MYSEQSSFFATSSRASASPSSCLDRPGHCSLPTGSLYCPPAEPCQKIQTNDWRPGIKTTMTSSMKRAKTCMPFQDLPMVLQTAEASLGFIL